MSELNCLLEDGSVDLDKLAKATQLMKEYRTLVEVVDALYDGYYAKESFVIQVELGPPSYCKPGDKKYDGSPYPSGVHKIPIHSSDVYNLLLNKAQVLKDMIEDLGFSAKLGKPK